MRSTRASPTFSRTQSTRLSGTLFVIEPEAPDVGEPAAPDAHFWHHEEIEHPIRTSAILAGVPSPHSLSCLASRACSAALSARSHAAAPRS
jgi:hypothetical protein